MKLKKLHYIVCVSLLLLLSVNTSAVPAAIPKGGKLTTALYADPGVLNPLAWATIYDLPVINRIYEPLAKTDLDQNIYPGSGLATGWTHSADNTIWTFNIYDNATWHDGEPVTIDDVFYSHDVLWSDPDMPRWDWLYEYTTDISVINTTAIQFTFSYGPKEIDVLTSIGLEWIMPKHIWEDVTDPATFANNNPIGCGIWKFEEWAAGDFIRFSRHEDYHLGAPYLTEHIMKITGGTIESSFYQLQTGSLDLLSGQIPPELEALARVDPNLQIWEGLDDWVDYVGMNQRRYPNNIVKFRQAVSHAINRTKVVENAYWGRGIEADAGMSLPYGPYYEPNIRQYEYDVAKANAMLDALGWTGGTWDGTEGVRETDNGTKLSFEFMYVSDVEHHINTAFLMQEFMEAIGVELILDPQIFDVEWHLVGGDGGGTYDFDWFYVGWTVFWSDHHPSWMGWMFDEDQWWGSDDVNIPGWSGINRSLVTNLTHQVAVTLDETETKDLLSQAQKIVAESLPYTPINWRGQIEIYRNDTLTGWKTLETTFGSPNNYRSWLALHLIEAAADGTSGFELLITLTALSAIIGVISRKRRIKN
jgi:peptide/nickel transport system substrate-binding protein